MKSITLSLDREEDYLLALSGGADSVCLFHLLHEGGYRFAAAHINHGIRGKEADRDEEFCRALCDGCGVKLHVLRRDVPTLARESGESLEETARVVRYSFFDEVMRENGIPVLLTAHNADDNAETLLLSLARGCSPSGACGIAPVRKLAFGRVERPLLPYSKREIVAFCREGGHEFVTDSTNSDISYPRNRVRANILPELEAINPQLLSAIARFTEAQREDCAYLDSLAEKYSEELDLSVLRSLPRPVASRALSSAAYRFGASPEAKHIDTMLRMAKDASGSVTLPGSVTASCDSGRIVFRRDTREKASSPYPEYAPVPIAEGENTVPRGKILFVCGELTNDFTQIYKLSTSAHINPDRIKGRMYARPRREGDRILLGGMHRNLKKLISERLSGLSLEERRSLPVVCDGEEIVWVPYLEVADSYRGTSHTLCYSAE